MPDHKTAIITGASRGIGAGLVEAFLKQGYNVVATSRNVSQQLTASTALILIDGDIGKPETAANVVSITAALADQPILGINGSVSMITKGGLNSIIRSLAIEYAKQGIRFNAVAPGVVDTPMHKTDPKDFLKTLQPMGGIADVKDVADAVLYLAEAGQVTGEVLHVDGGSHAGRW